MDDSPEEGVADLRGLGSLKGTVTFSLRLPYRVCGTVENLTLNEDWLHVIFNHHVWVLLSSSVTQKSVMYIM